MVHSVITDVTERIIDRSAELPTGGHIDQSDGTAWMAAYSLQLMKMALDLSREEATKGGSFNLTYTQLIPGTHGSIDRKRRTLSVKVAAGTKHGKEIRVKGQGHGHPQGVNGDLIVNIRIDPGEGCRWDGNRVVKEVEVEYSTLVLGGKVTVTLPSGVKGKITIPPLSQVGDRQRVKDLDIEFILDEPESLTAEQIEVLKSLQNAGL